MDIKNFEGSLSASKAALLKTNLSRLATAQGAPKNLSALREGAAMAGRVGRDAPVQFGTTTTQTADWIPADVYAQVVFMGLHAERVLGALAAAVAIDIQKGASDTIQVRVFPKRTAQGPISEGSSLSDTALGSLTTKSITIQAYGDYDQLTGQALDFTTDDVKGRLLGEMGAALNEKLEQVCYNVLVAASSTQTTTLDVAGIIDYEEVLKAQAKLKLQKMKPDILVIGANHEVDLLLDARLTKTVNYAAGSVVLPGEIGRIGNIRVLVHPLANDKSASAAAINGVMLDSSRAFAEAFGRPLSFEEQRVPESNKWKEVAWVFYGAGVIDPNAICLMKNA